MKANKIVFTIIILLLIDFILTGCAPPVPEVIEVTGVSIIEDDQSINIGDTLQLTAVVTPEDADNKAVTWESDNTDVAAVDENGLVTALKKGIANITVITEDSAFTDTIKITVTEPACGGVTPGTDPPTINSFTADSYHIISGESVTLSWNVTGADSVTINQGIGTVDSTGTKVVNPTATITYTLTASNTNGSVTNTVTVNVGSALGSIDINSNPAGAKVYLDGVDTGHITPIVLTNIAAGSHTVKLELFHYQNREDTNVTVTAGETTYINWALTYAPIIVLAIGDDYQGGKIAYIFVEGDPGYVPGETHGLIAASADQSTGIAWSNITDTLVGTATAIGTGKTNTAAIVAQAGCTGGAAYLCYHLTEGGYSDWFLPSKDELDKLWENRTEIGGFDDSDGYWSSSDASANYAWLEYFFSGGYHYSSNKFNSYRVRAVRYF